MASRLFCGVQIPLPETVDHFRRRIQLENRRAWKFPAAVLENYSESDPDINIVAYGGASEQVLDVMRTLIEEEIKVRAIFPSELSVGSNEPWWFSEISSNVPIILAEHGTMSFNWGSEIASLIHRFFFNKLAMPVTRLSSSDDVIPAASEKEKANLLSANQIMKSIFHCLSHEDSSPPFLGTNDDIAMLMDG